MLPTGTILLRLAFAALLGAAIGVVVQQFLAELKIKMQHFSVSMAGAASIVEFEAHVSYRQQEAILTRLSRSGIISEVVPFERHHE